MSTGLYWKHDKLITAKFESSLHNRSDALANRTCCKPAVSVARPPEENYLRLPFGRAFDARRNVSCSKFRKGGLT